jgi:Zn-dependent protease with chaperone function
MNLQAAGIFYDGQSSVPQKTIISLNKYKGSLSFESESGLYKEWFVKEVVFEMVEYGLQMQYQSADAMEILKTTDATFITAVHNYRKENGYESWYEKLLNKGFKTHSLLATVIFALIGLTYFYAIPWVGEKSVAVIPESYDNTLGGTFVQDNLLFSDLKTSKTKTLNAFAKELQLNNSKPLKFIFVKEDIINAFALPDGTIVVYSGIVDKMQNYDELVALLGHESAHVNNRHAMKMLCRNLSGYLFISAILGDANGVMAIIGDNVNSLQSLSFSRKFEQEADVEGLNILFKNKVNPEGMSTLFSRLKSKDGLSIPEFLSSHPVTEERIKYIQELNKNSKHKAENNKKLAALFQELKQ